MKARVVAVACSGGRDSMALLHATVHATAATGARVVALHVHHGLHPDADAWLDHCRRTCERWARRGWPVAFDAHRVSGTPPKGESVEAWARRERYRALAAMARRHEASLVLLAHHRRDQAETFVLQALRGAGVAGLAGMPAVVERDGITWARPWLQQPREAIESYVRRHRLRFVDDGSNDDARFARNRLRRDVWPALVNAFPQAEAALADAAAWSAHASELLHALARDDLATLVDARGLAVAPWKALSEARRRNALHGWLREHGRAPASLLDRLLAELPHATTARWPLDATRELRLHRGRLSVQATARGVVRRNAPAAHADTTITITRAGRHLVPGWPDGRLEARRVARDGVAASLLVAARVAPRSGGERFQLAPRSVPRSLKKQYQALGVPPWERGGPLLWQGERLLFVPGLGIDARVRAAPGERQFALSWVPVAPAADG